MVQAYMDAAYMEEVVSLKRMTTILTTLTLVAALSAAMISLTIQSPPGFRVSLSQILIAVAMGGLFLLAASGGRRKRPEVAVTGRGSPGKRPQQACTFSDVAANEQALQSLEALRNYLKHPDKYVRYGARMPRGVVLYGPPGTGKTLLARALAGEAGVPFFALSGSDFVEKYVGVGASRVRALFKKARKAGKCVIFIDEIDAMGKRRDDSASDERDQTLNALLSEMSGFYTGEGIIVVAATNRIEALDPALLRPGRFDRQIEVGLPGKAQRLSILKLHSRGKPLDADVNLEELAAQTVSFSGASLENLLNEAALTAAERDDGGIGARDLQQAFFKTIAGADREMIASDRERRIISVHESGHAVASHCLSPENRLTRVSILPAGHGAAGYNLCIPKERVMVEKSHLENQIQVLLAGRAAEQLVFGEDALTAGASSDLAKATELAAAMVMELGMWDDPSVSLKALGRFCGTGGATAESCKALLREQYARVLDLLSARIAAVTALSDALLEAEALEGEAIEAILDPLLSIKRPESP